MVVTYLLIALFLLALNGFFVLAEFAAVKMRPSRVEELVNDGVQGAKAVQQIHDHLDEYLSVCQLGITFASIGLGFVAEPAIVRLIEPIIAWTGWFPEESVSGWVTTHGVAFTISYLIVSFMHILVGELVPKSAAIRLTDRASLLTARPLKIFRALFYVPLKLLNASANLVLRLIGLHDSNDGEVHSEDELRILLSESQTGGVMSFRRLLFVENVFDLGELRVKDAMRPRSQVRVLQANVSWDTNLEQLQKYRFSRYPLIAEGSTEPVGIIHIKDLLLADKDEPNLMQLRRTFISVQETSQLEALLSEMQRRRIHVALVHDSAGNWTGFLTLEDVIEEIIGTIRDEFEDEEHVSLSDALAEDQVFLNIEASNSVEAIRTAFARMSHWRLPVSKESIVKAIEERERVVETYLGKGLGMPHARVAGLFKPVVFFIRSEEGITYRGNPERAYILFVLLSPAGQPRIHQRLQAVIATIMDESEFIPDRLKVAETAAEVLDVLKTGEQAALD
jgi:CBS domain containing-hemolysin-like protein/mannitol/fructose-specific phosphotransferase system IIA component (Ntr-type)